MFTIPDDVRFHSYYRDIPADNFTWSTDWSKFVGIPGLLPGERLIYDNGHYMIRLTNAYWHYSIYISIVYVFIIFAIKSLMSRKETGFDLRYGLITWNLFLTLFSFIGTIRCLPEFFHVLYNNGFVASYTQNTYVDDIRVNAWYLFFTLSKAPEMVDTLFIVLRKRRLINLHWIHHTLTLIYSWFVFGDMPSTARWMVNMNLVIHTMMYLYYALAAMRIRIPRQVSITITTLQIVQMFVGLYINVDCLHRKLSAMPCDLSFSVALSGFSLYFLFFVLFVNFFIRTYIIPTSSKAVKAAVANGKTILADLNNNSAKDKSAAATCGEMVKKLQ